MVYTEQFEEMVKVNSTLMGPIILKSSSFTIIINEARPDSWPDIVWRDARDAGANVLLDSSKPLPSFLRKLRQIHFSNIANRKVWLPLKRAWDFSNTLRISDLDRIKRNYVIFQTGIKFSAHYIERLKRERNACIVLYMPDNVRTKNIAQTREEFERFKEHYHIDQVYSFDKKDCEEFEMEFFDFYSMLPTNVEKKEVFDGKPKILYVGGCRSKERLNTLHTLYDNLKDKAHCTFYLNGVEPTDASRNGIVYNHPLTYAEVIGLVLQHDIIVELMNGAQSGNTLRLKEAVCYNKCLLTNNLTVKDSPYYHADFMQVFRKVNDIDLSRFTMDVDYKYNGEFSPCKLMERIINKDNIE